MKSTVESLSKKERQLLALFFETETYKALMTLLELNKTQFMKSHVGEKDIGQIRYLSGGIGSLNKVIVDLETNYKTTQKS